MTTTIEMIERLEHEAKELRAVMPNVSKNEWADNNEAIAQRLRDLDEQVKQQINDYGRGMAAVDLAPKPDCVWHKVGETFDTACNARYRDGAYSTWKTCPNCSGKVREST